jgi:hypothetical protein
MSYWYIGRRGISLNEGGRFLTFSFVKLSKGNSLGKWLLHFYIFIPGIFEFGAVDKFYFKEKTIC